MSDSKFSAAHRDLRKVDTRVVDIAWRKEKLAPVDILVPNYELPLPEGVGEEKFQQEHMSQREIADTWKERLHSNDSQNLSDREL